MIIAIDFDGTCVKHAYPLIGDDIGAVPVLQGLITAGHKLILNTMRSDTSENGDLSLALKWFEKNNIPLYGVNKNPTQDSWTKSPKVYAQLYIDDAALGAPLIKEPNERPYIDWHEIEKWFKRGDIYYLPHDDIKCGGQHE